jgi:transcription elongation factor GreA
MAGKTMGEVVAQFIATMDQEIRHTTIPELNRFASWFGSTRPFDELNALDIEKYQDRVQTDGAPIPQRLGPVKDMLAYCQKEKLLDTNLAKFLRVPRKSGKKAESRSESQAVTPEAIKLSAEGLQRLREELRQLITVERKIVARELHDARLDKDIRENAGFDAAKQHQGMVEARIRDLEAVLGRAEINEEINKHDTASLGSRVVVADVEKGTVISYTLVDGREANVRERKISIASPVGKALLYRSIGEEVDINTPGGVIRYRVESIEY